MIDAGIYLTYALIIVAILAAVILPLMHAAGDPKSLMKTGIGIGSAVGVYLIAYIISGDEVTKIYQEFNVDAGTSKLVGGGIIMTYLLGLLAVGGIIYGEVMRLIK